MWFESNNKNWKLQFLNFHVIFSYTLVCDNLEIIFLKLKYFTRVLNIQGIRKNGGRRGLKPDSILRGLRPWMSQTTQDKKVNSYQKRPWLPLKIVK